MSKFLDKVVDLLDKHSILLFGSMATLELLYLVEGKLKGS